MSVMPAVYPPAGGPNRSPIWRRHPPGVHLRFGLELCGFPMTAALAYRSRALTAVAVALPVPLLAALGLSLPLPATVERLAARLVPFADQSVFEGVRADAVVRGSIVSAAGEGLVRLRVRDSSGRTRVISVPRSAIKTRNGHVIVVSENAVLGDADVISEPATAKSSTSSPTSQPPAAAAAADGAQPQAPATQSGPAPTATTPTTTTSPASTSDPAPAPAPVPTPTQVVDSTTATASNTVTTVSNTVTTATDTGQNTVTTVTNTVGGVVGGVHP